MTQAMVAGAVPAPPPETRARKTVLEPSLLEADRRVLWGLCYRITGSASDADDVVQETFVRAMDRPPKDLDAPLRPWLVRVAVNLARDHLRRRKRRDYHGVWLPTPVEMDLDEGGLSSEPVSTDSSPETRYGLLESASFAFLVAMEALTPTQRTVLVLRDAFDYSSRETAEALDVSEENVRVSLHRARRAMASYDDRRAPPSAERTSEVQSLLVRFLTCLADQDLRGAASLLATDARSLGDGGGVYHAAPAPVVGAEKIVKLYANLSKRRSADAAGQVRTVNGVPAALAVDPNPGKPNAPRAVIFIDVGRDGKIHAMYSVIAPEKLTRVAWS